MKVRTRLENRTRLAQSRSWLASDAYRKDPSEFNKKRMCRLFKKEARLMKALELSPYGKNLVMPF